MTTWRYDVEYVGDNGEQRFHSYDLADIDRPAFDDLVRIAGVRAHVGRLYVNGHLVDELRLEVH